jgi:pimeloyl-ACP methyl ester carboxylesterase
MEKFFRFRDKSIFFRDIGCGKPVILLHGYLETSEVWLDFAQKLSEKFRVIIPDLPGHGCSSIMGEVLSMELIAEVQNELLKNLGISKVCMVGHSLGGYVALAFAELFPEKLSGYVLFHSHPLADTPAALEKREREINLVIAGKKDLMYPENVRRMFATSNLERFSDALQKSRVIASSIPGDAIIGVLRGMMMRISRLHVIEKGESPCLWILGAMDNYIDVETVTGKVHLPANAELVILKESGHLGFIEEEDLSVELLSSFIRKL